MPKSTRKPIFSTIAVIAFCAGVMLAGIFGASSLEDPWQTRAPLAETIAADLRDNPDGWTGDAHFIQNDRWVMWVPNGWSHLKVCAVRPGRTTADQYCYGGDARFNRRSRKHIWNAATGTIKQIDQRRMAALEAAT